MQIMPMITFLPAPLCAWLLCKQTESDQISTPKSVTPWQPALCGGEGIMGNHSPLHVQENTLTGIRSKIKRIKYLHVQTLTNSTWERG